MSTTLSAMTAAELVAELKRLDLLIQKMAEMHRQTVWDFAPRDKATSLQDITNRTNDRFAVVAELNAQCKLAGIRTNPNNTLSIPEFTGTADELTEFLALVNYAKGTLK